MLIERKQAKKFEQPTCTVLEYGGKDELDIAVARITGRYPEKGKARNTKCTMMYYLLTGKGKVIIEDETFEVKEGDAVLFEPGKWYWVEGDLEVVIASSPRWSPEQYEHKE